MRIGRALAATVGSLAIVGLPLATASAAPTAPSQVQSASAAPRLTDATVRSGSVCRGNNHGAYACFKSYGDKFYIKDTKNDGYSVEVDFKTDYGRKGGCFNTYGAGSGWAVCNFNMKENHKLTFWTVDYTTYTLKYKYWSWGKTATI